VIDAFCAVVLLLGLGISLGLIIGLINALASETLIDLRHIIDGMRDPVTRPEYTWLYLCLASTLIPTLVHTVIMLLSAFTWIPSRYKSVIANLIENGQTGDIGTLFGTVIASTIGAAYAAFVASMLVLIYTFFAHGFEPFGMWLLNCIETVLIFVGAV
jgi:hypothetical protein